IDTVRVDKCRMSFIDQPLTYDTLKGGKFLTRTFQAIDANPNRSNNCTALVVAEIAVNCVGDGKRLCRVGNPCVADEDCETGACSSCSGGTCNGVGTCQSVCGNGMREFAPEALDPQQSLQCALNVGTLGGLPLSNCELCDDGNTSNCGTCSATCGLLFAQGPHTCPVGTSCINDQDCTGLCDFTLGSPNPDCPSCGTCASVCGNGVAETGEACDDGNTDTCGPCNATCSAAGTGTCPNGTGCNANGVCTSNKCVGNVCVP